MTVSTTTNRVDYTGNGSTTVFSFTFRIFADTDLVVTTANDLGVETELVLGDDYTVSGVGSYNGGSITLGTALTNGYAMTIQRVLPFTQETDLRNQGAFYAETHEDVFDRMAMVNQQLQEQIDRSAKLPVTSLEDADALVADLVLLADHVTQIDTVADNIADVTTVADDLNEPTSEINTVAVNIANINLVGESITDVNAVADIVADVETVAANIADIQNAEENADAAAASASAAAASESSAASSAAAAAAALDSFDDRYLGAKSTAPTVDNDGNALVSGALYYDTAEGSMFVYDGAQWIQASAAAQAILVVYKFTATAGQTTFTGTDDGGLTLGYTVGSAIVTVNGTVMEVGTDVTASSGSSVVLAVAAALNDEINVYAFSTFNIANTYTKAEVDAQISTTNWQVVQSGTDLLFKYSGVSKAKLDSSGNLTVVGNVTAYGTV